MAAESNSRRRRHTDGARILVIEDTEELRALMTFTLQEEGYVVDSAPSAEAGMRLLERYTYRLVLSDFALPGNSGVWLISEAAERGLLRGAAARLVTGEPDAPAVVGAAIGVVAKPVDFRQFLPQVRAILASTDPIAPAVATASQDAVDLVLYVSAASLPCARAARAMRKILKGYDHQHVHLAICDVAGDPAQAAIDHVVFTPTLVKRRPAPRLWIVGDLTQPKVITDLLSACGVPQRPH